MPRSSHMMFCFIIWNISDCCCHIPQQIIFVRHLHHPGITMVIMIIVKHETCLILRQFNNSNHKQEMPDNILPDYGIIHCALQTKSLPTFWPWELVYILTLYVYIWYLYTTQMAHLRPNGACHTPVAVQKDQNKNSDFQNVPLFKC